MKVKEVIKLLRRRWMDYDEDERQPSPVQTPNQTRRCYGCRKKPNVDVPVGTLNSILKTAF